MPQHLVVAEAADRHAVLHDVGNHRDVLVIARRLSFADDRHFVEHTEARAERGQVVVADPLIADHDYQILEPRFAYRIERGGIEAAQIDASHERAERVWQRFNLHAGGFHWGGGCGHCSSMR